MHSLRWYYPDQVVSGIISAVYKQHPDALMQGKFIFKEIQFESGPSASVIALSVIAL